MGYIGTDINYGDIHKQVATSTGSTTPTGALDYSVPKSESIIVTLDGVTQVPGTDYNVTSGTTLTFTTSVPAGVVVLVYFLGRSLDIGTPGTGTVTNASVDASAAIAQSKLVDIVNADVDASAAIATSKLSGAVTSIASHGLATSATTDTTNATNIASGTLPDARFPATLPASSGVNLTALNGSNIGSGTVPTARLGSGTASSSTFLRGDSTYAAAGGGKVVKSVNDLVTGVLTGTTTMPNDDSIPQLAEGNDLGLEVSITPSSATNKLLIQAVVNGDCNSEKVFTIALFQDSTSNALAAAQGCRDSSSNDQHQVILHHWMTAGTTSSTTFKIRAGATSGTFTLNGVGGSRKNGGVNTSSITVTEIDPS